MPNNITQEKFNLPVYKMMMFVQDGDDAKVHEWKMMEKLSGSFHTMEQGFLSSRLSFLSLSLSSAHRIKPHKKQA